MTRVTYWLFIICFPLLLLTCTVRLGVGSAQIYEYGFDKYQISEVTGLDRAQLSEVTERLTGYFSSKAATPQIKVVNKYGEEFELFQEHELVHLEDVKELFQVAYLVQAIVIGYIVVYILLFLLWKKGRWQDLAKGVTRGSALILIVAVILGIASIFIDFEQLFIGFHYLIFGDPSSSPWMLDPSKDYLIMLFPGGFWQDVAFLGGVTIIGGALLCGGIAWLIPSINQRHKKTGQE